MKKTIAACVAVIAVSAGAITFETDDDFSITLPNGWVQIPGSVLQQFAAETSELSPAAPRQVYDYGYQIEDGGKWLTYPYILVQVRPEGRIPSGELARFHKMNSQMGEVDLSEVRYSEPTYDKANQILWSTLTMQPMDGRALKALVAVKLTELGYIRLTGCATDASFNEYENLFIDAFSSLDISESIAYKPQFTDAMPVVGGIMTGKVLIWCIQAVVIGGVLWLVYIFLRRMARRRQP